MRLCPFSVRAAALAATVLSAACARAAQSEISVDLKMDTADYVSGERIRGVVDVVNSSPDRVAVGTTRVFAGQGEDRRQTAVVEGRDHLFVEVLRASDMSRVARLDSRPFVSLSMNLNRLVL